jgi:hypothetical protein
MATDPQLQGFLSGGDKITTQRGGAGQAFSPTDATKQPKLEVVAPLDVNAAPGQAQALAKALNVGLAVATPAVEEKARMQGAGEAASGQADVALNQVDQDKMAKIDAYRMGATRAITEKATLSALDKAQAFAASAEGQKLPLTDTQTDGTSPMKKGLLSTLDDMLRTDLSHLTGDPQSARVVAPMVQHFMNEVAGQRTERDIKNNQSAAEDSAQAIAMHAARTNDGSFNWQEQFDKLSGVYGGDRRAASQALVHSIGAAAVAAKDPSIIDKFIPESTKTADGQTLAGPGQTPENEAYLTEARAHAVAAQKGQWTEDRGKDAVTITTAIIAGKDPRAMLRDYAAKPGADHSFIEGAWNFYQSQRRQGEADALDSPTAYAIQRKISVGEVTTPAQLVQEVNASGLQGKAASQMLTKGLDTLRNVQSVGQDDPSVRAGASEIDGTYKPVTGPAGNILTPAAAAQHTAAMADYRQLVQQYMHNGKSGDEAAVMATQDVKKKYGSSMNNPDGTANTSGKMPRTDNEQAAVVRTQGTSAPQLINAGINADALRHLYDTGSISFVDYEAATQTLIQHHTK